MKKLLTGLFMVSVVFLSGISNAENSFTTALKTCAKYSQQGGAMHSGQYYNILITLDKNRNNCVYKEKIYQDSGYQMLTCNFKKSDLEYLSGSMSNFTTVYKDQVDKNKIYEAKLTNNFEIFEKYLINPKYCKITMSKTK